MKNEKILLPTGALRYTLTNDFLFKAFLQQNEEALKGLLCALLDLKKEDIKSITIMNPIEEGDSIEEKTLVLDIKLLLNTNEIINIEMQVDDLGNWEERSLTYLCRAFDHLHAGEDYRNVKRTVHIGILDFSPKGFPKEFYMDYYLYNRKCEHIYSDKLSIRMLQLNQLEKIEDKEKETELYYWARLFKATTWEEIAMLAEKSESINEGIVTLKKLSEDEKIRMQCEARENYRRDMASAIQHGEEKGLNQGIKAVITDNIEQGLTKEKIIEKLQKLFTIEEEQAKHYYEKYFDEENNA